MTGIAFLKTNKMGMDPQLRQVKGISSNKLLDTFITLIKQDINCRVNLSKKFCSSIDFYNWRAILLNNSTNLKQEKRSFNLQPIRNVSAQKMQNKVFPQKELFRGISSLFAVLTLCKI